MPRIRTIKPEFFLHEELAGCSAHARLMAIGLLTLADCEGRLRWIEAQVKGHLFPWEAEVNVRVLLAELVAVHWCAHGKVDGKEYVEVLNFRKHQRLSGREATAESILPSVKDLEPVKHERSSGEASDASRGSAGCCLEQGNRGTGEQGNRDTPQGPPSQGGGAKFARGRLRYPQDYPAAFIELRDAYPRRTGGDPNPQALSAWQSLCKDQPEWTHDRLLTQIRAYNRQCQERGIVGTELVMQMASFLGPKRQGYADDWSSRGRPTGTDARSVEERNRQAAQEWAGGGS